ncbi:MAG TPA: cob(I)yrinic acid a,c-diamide adenosyltransferase [Longimicrobiales bacterium]
MTQRIYTRTGDAGETGLFGGVRVSKANARVCAYGDVDELNAVIGWAITQLRDDEISMRLRVVQADLFAIGAHLATVPRAGRRGPTLPALPGDRIAEMEAWIDAAEDALPELRSFILPGGSTGGAALHVARTVCRRAERAVVELGAAESVDALILTYLNRLSDLLFDLARLANARAGSSETAWQP